MVSKFPTVSKKAPIVSKKAPAVSTKAPLVSKKLPNTTVSKKARLLKVRKLHCYRANVDGVVL